MKKLAQKKGVILIVSCMVITVLMILTTAFFSLNTNEKRLIEKNKTSLQAFYLAEAGLEHIKRDLYLTFNNAFSNGNCTINWFDNLVNNTEVPVYSGPAGSLALTNAQNRFMLNFGPGRYTVEVVSVNTVNGTKDVGLRSRAQVLDSAGQILAEHTIDSTVRYALARSEVFDYVYFVNNFGWMYGGSSDSNGDERANGNFYMTGNPLVNGNIYAAVNPDLGASGDITGNNAHDSINQYRWTHNGDQARPTNPPFDPKPGEAPYEYKHGYDGQSQHLSGQSVLEMPYLGNLNYYKNLAQKEKGSIVQKGKTIVDETYSGAGPDGISGTADDGCLVLIGTEQHPIQIEGPVVVEKDVVIRGVVKGHGTIYAGRNIHIVGDLTYQSPASWPKPDTKPEKTAKENQKKDLLCLASKGNVVMGNYTAAQKADWWGWVWQYTFNYMKPPFTQAYKVDLTDAVNGYVSYYKNGVPYFDGDYTRYDGGAKDNGCGGVASRKYYESSLSDNLINSIATDQIKRIDATIYTNHAWGGRIGDTSTGCVLNGAHICRDESIVFLTYLKMNHDVRLPDDGLEDTEISIPRSVALPQTRSWETH